MISYLKFILYSFGFLILSCSLYSSQQENESFEYISEFLPNDENGNSEGGFRIVIKAINKIEQSNTCLEKTQ